MGFWPAPPARRMPWDRDGSALIHISAAAVITTRSQTERQWTNDESNSTPGYPASGAGTKFAVVFAIPQTVVAAFVSQNGNMSGLQWLIEYSLDTTTGNDGTWSTFRAVGAYGQEQDVPTNYRALVSGGNTHGIYVAGAPIPDVKGMRVRVTAATGSAFLSAFHIYGQPTNASNRLMLWHPTLDQSLAATPAIYDLGDIPRGTGPQNFSFRVKNISGSLTAQSVTLIREILTDGSPSVLGLMRLRYNGGAWGTSAAVGNIAPGAISAVCDCELDITPTAPVGPWAPRIVAAAASWV